MTIRYIPIQPVYPHDQFEIHFVVLNLNNQKFKIIVQKYCRSIY